MQSSTTARKLNNGNVFDVVSFSLCVIFCVPWVLSVNEFSRLITSSETTLNFALTHSHSRSLIGLNVWLWINSNAAQQLKNHSSRFSSLGYHLTKCLVAQLMRSYSMTTMKCEEFHMNSLVAHLNIDLILHMKSSN